MTDLKSRADEVIMEVIDDAQAHALNPDKYTICIAKESLAALTHFVHVLCEVASVSKLALGEHCAPGDCYATGPLTGNPIADLVACPGCALQTALAALEKAND